MPKTVLAGMLPPTVSLLAIRNYSIPLELRFKLHRVPPASGKYDGVPKPSSAAKLWEEASAYPRRQDRCY